MSTPPNSGYRYQVGGSLPESAPTYIKRWADEVFCEKLKKGMYCYVLNSRQMGKSSLRVQTMKTLKMEGFACASIEMRDICSHAVTPEEFYGGFIQHLESEFNLQIDVGDWWRKHEHLNVSMRLSVFLEKELLEKISQPIVIFIDEIDSVLSLEFRDDFFMYIRSCYNKRADSDKYNRLTFALLGVATPADLIKDATKSSFNIESEPIELTGFELNQTMPLQKGLEGKVKNPKAVMAEVLKWTGGQPFLTQLLCKLILDYDLSIPTNQEAQCVEKIVQKQIIEDWLTKDPQQHFQTIRERILNRGDKTSGLLKLYKTILNNGEIVADNSPEQMELRLSGLVVKRQGKLIVYNKLYKSIFNDAWLNKALRECENNEPITNSQYNELSFEKGVDYTRLDSLLQAQEWKKADEETLAVMLKVAGREKEGWLDDESIENFPCTDLRTIDLLWVKYSNGRFGFSVQKQIYLEVGGIPDDSEYYEEAWEKFGDRVGWRVKKSWIYGRDVIFDTTAPSGHLPVLGSAAVGVWGVGGVVWFGVGGWLYGLGWISSLASRLVKCNL